MRTNLILWLLLVVASTGTMMAQSGYRAEAGAAASGSPLDRILAFPGKLSHQLSEQQTRAESWLQKQTQKSLRKLQKQETRLRRKLEKQDSALAASLQLGSDSLYHNWKQILDTGSTQLTGLPATYSGKLDSMTTALKFLENDPTLAKLQGPELEKLKSQYKGISNRLNQTEQLQQLVAQRKQQLKEKLAHLPLGKTWRKYQQQAGYYQEQLQQFKQALNDPNQLEQKALELLSHIPAFRKFFDKYSILGSMFRLPGQVADMDPSTLLNGLQTRDQVLNNLTQRMGSTQAAQQALTSGMQEGQAALESVKSQLEKALSKEDETAMPNYKPAESKGRNFLKRVELGANIQSTRANGYFPTTSDIAGSLGFRVNKNSVVGIGATYKVGWGQDIRHIAVSHQGMGLRTFIDVRIKKSFWLTGGGEWNYRSEIESLAVLKTIRHWQQSAVIGLQQKQQIGKYKSTFSLLYDALWNRQLPHTQPLLFRVGYQFK